MLDVGIFQAFKSSSITFNSKIHHKQKPLFQKTRLFLKELERIIPNSTVFHRRQAKVKNIISQSIDRGYTDVIVVNEDKKIPSMIKFILKIRTFGYVLVVDHL